MAAGAAAGHVHIEPEHVTCCSSRGATPSIPALGAAVDGRGTTRQGGPAESNGLLLCAHQRSVPGYGALVRAVE